MSRAYTPSGRFDTDFETNEIHDAITKDLTNPVGTTVMWYVWDSVATHVDPIYDVGASDGVGRQWKTPVDVPTIRAVVKQSQTDLIEEGFYNADRLHLTLDKELLSSLIPGVLDNPDPLNRDRIVWKGQVYRPLMTQLLGIISERFAIISFECQQIMPEEMVNDSQFQDYASSLTLYGEGTYGYGSYGG
jgi:hypothetical protein